MWAGCLFSQTKVSLNKSQILLPLFSSTGEKHLQLWDENFWKREFSETKCLELRGRGYSLLCVHGPVLHHMGNPCVLFIFPGF